MGVEIIVTGANYANTRLNNIYLAKTMLKTYFANTGIVDATHKTAVTNFAYALSEAGVLKKMSALWLFTGDTYDKVKLNLINQSANILASIPAGNISAGLALSTLPPTNTNFMGDSNFVQNGHIAFYNSTIESTAISIPINDTADTSSGSSYWLSRSVGSPSKIGFGVKGFAPFTALKVTERGLFLGSHSADVSSVYSKGVLIESVAKVNTGSPSLNMTIGTSSNASYKSSMKLQLVSVGSFLTASESLAYSNACEAFMTALGR